MIARPLAAERTIGIWIDAALSPPVVVAVPNSRLGGVSLSRIVTVSTGVAPIVAPVGGSMRSTAPSFASSRRSSTIEIVREPLSDPARIVTVVVERV